MLETRTQLTDDEYELLRDLGSEIVLRETEGMRRLVDAGLAAGCDHPAPPGLYKITRAGVVFLRDAEKAGQ